MVQRSPRCACVELRGRRTAPSVLLLHVRLMTKRGMDERVDQAAISSLTYCGMQSRRLINQSAVAFAKLAYVRWNIVFYCIYSIYRVRIKKYKEDKFNIGINDVTLNSVDYLLLTLIIIRVCIFRLVLLDLLDYFVSE